MDSGPAPSGASRNDDWDQFFAPRCIRGTSNPSTATTNVDSPARPAAAITAAERRVAVRQGDDGGSEQNFVRIQPPGACDAPVRIRMRREPFFQPMLHCLIARAPTDFHRDV